MTEFLSRPGGHFHAALYELEDRQLVALLEAAAPRMQLILSDAGKRDGKDKPTGKPTHTYDTRNADARAALRSVASKPNAKFIMQDRLFNGTSHIGHNKFVVWSDDQGPKAVLTGSTNWTWSGICGQSNNCIVIADAGVADAYLKYWQRLFDNPLHQPAKTSDPNPGADQGDTLKESNLSPVTGNLINGASFECWYSPDVPKKQQPPRRRPRSSPRPRRIWSRLFSLMRKAHKIILFAVFLPSKAGVHSIISQAIDLGLADAKLEVVGAVSDPLAWGYQPSGKDANGNALVPASPYIIQQGWRERGPRDSADRQGHRPSAR
ncbi:phospholipase D-like domain-containing protein [Rhizobium beringeri]